MNNKIPNNWQEEPLSNILEKIIDYRGQSVPKAKVGIPLITARNVKKGYLDFSMQEYVEPALFEQWMSRGKPCAGDILFTTEAPLGNACRFPDDKLYAVGQRTVTLRSKKNKLISDYLLYFLLSERGQLIIDHRSSGSTAKGIKSSELKKIKIIYPISIDEQIKIAKILSIWDKAIETTEQLLSNSQQQKKALMQQLLTGKKRFLRFKEEWKKIFLSDLVLLNPKKAEKPKDGLVSFIPMDAVSEDAKLLRMETRQYDDIEKGFTSFINEDVIIAKITPCFENGKGAFLTNLTNQIGFGSTEFHVLRAKKENCAKFIYYITITSDFRIRGEANMQGSAGQKRVTTDYLRLYKIFGPTDKNEQQKIASILSATDHEIETLKQQLAILNQEKKALMQQLLTGKRRVKIYNITEADYA